MKLVIVDSPALIKAFHQMPFSIYADDPNWIPYLKQDVEKVFDPKKNKLFTEGGVACRWLLFDGEGKAIGRVAAFINPRSRDLGKLKVGGMGFFECVRDYEAARLLFDTCKTWLEAQGIEAMDGPINFGERNQFWGCQISNYEEPPIYLMNYNPVYYRDFFERYGFQTYFEQYVYWRSVAEPPQPIFHRKYKQLKDDPNIKIINVKGLSPQVMAKHFKDIYNDAWGGHAFFKEMTDEGALKIFKAMKPVLDPEIVYFVFYADKPIAFYLNLPELNAIFKYVHGDLNWLGKLKFLYYKWKGVSHRMNGQAFGVIKEWQGKGVEAAMIVHASAELQRKGVYKDTVLSWIGDFNPKMIKVVQNLGTTLWRSLITYRYQFDRSLPFEREKTSE